MKKIRSWGKWILVLLLVLVLDPGFLPFSLNVNKVSSTTRFESEVPIGTITGDDPIRFIVEEEGHEDLVIGAGVRDIILKKSEDVRVDWTLSIPLVSRGDVAITYAVWEGNQFLGNVTLRRSLIIKGLANQREFVSDFEGQALWDIIKGLEQPDAMNESD
ncbi:MAG TPA: hypothetical protein DCE41_16750 [Cytophagales bacterium]|nr:hypothetical protein [Cytophagales bacterium]